MADIERPCAFTGHRPEKLAIAVYNGVPGGTQKTIEYAKSLGREVVAFALEPAHE